MSESQIIAEAIARSPDGSLNDPNILKLDNPPLLRFERGTLENRQKTIETGRYTHKDATFVHVRSYGDNKTEVPYVVWTTEMEPTEEEVIERKIVMVKVRHVNSDGYIREEEVPEERDERVTNQTWKEVEVTPWEDTLRYKVRNGLISQQYVDYCLRQYSVWKEKGDVPLDGFPVVEWNMISPAQQRSLIDAGINTVERVAEMNEEAMEVVGMGARDIKKKAETWINAGVESAQATARILNLEQEKEQDRTYFEQKIAELEAKMLEMEAHDAINDS
jgi:hypothetical protein